jgi:beta-galactosidase
MWSPGHRGSPASSLWRRVDVLADTATSARLSETIGFDIERAPPFREQPRMTDRIMKTFAALLAILLPLSATSAAEPPSTKGTSAARTSFNDHWLFERYGPMPDGSTRPEPPGLEKRGVADGKWRAVDVPHDWGIEGPFRMDLPGSTGKLPWVGIGWYRKHFTVSSADKGKCFSIDFDGAMSHAKVWLNGNFIGEWPYGYASFRLDLTDQIQFGKENIIAVRLENPDSSSRWYPGSGLYRNVWLVKSGKVHLAHWGTTITTPEVGNERATVRVRTEIQNQSSKSANVTLKMEFGEAGNPVALATSSSAIEKIPKNGSGVSQTEMILGSPRLWSLSSPTLYWARTTLLQNNEVVDKTETMFGIRSAVFSADSGFILNGRRVRINGVCNHHDLGPLGTAVSVSALSRQIRLLKEMGCNAIRTSHNPPAPELLDLCDSMGMLVLDEAFDCWKEGKNPNDYNTLFEKWSEKDIRAFVRRDRNHPSVIAWSAGNEVLEQDDGLLAQQLAQIFRSEDSTRPVTAGCDNSKAGFNGFQHAVDLFGYNYKPHRYGEFHSTNPTLPLFGSETASCISTNGEYFFPVSNDKSRGASNNQVSSYDLYAPPWATIPDVEFEAQDRNPFVAGEFVWTGFDYLGEPTPYGGDDSPSRSSYFGILDLCGFPKDRFYLYQSRWRPEYPMAHILPHWNWPDRIGQITPVHVYSSGDQAELFLNGKSLGRKTKGPYEYRFRWDSVAYAPGELKVIAYRNGAEWATDLVKTTGPPAKIELRADRSAIAADGRDLGFVTVTVVDNEGRRVPTSDNVVRFRVDQMGVLAAAANGDPTNHDSFRSDRYKAFHGQCLAIIRSAFGRKGKIVVTAEADGLQSGSVAIESR